MAIKMMRKCKKKEEISINSSHFNFSYFSYFSFQGAIMGYFLNEKHGMGKQKSCKKHSQN